MAFPIGAVVGALAPSLLGGLFGGGKKQQQAMPIMQTPQQPRPQGAGFDFSALLPLIMKMLEERDNDYTKTGVMGLAQMLPYPGNPLQRL